MSQQTKTKVNTKKALEQLDLMLIEFLYKVCDSLFFYAFTINGRKEYVVESVFNIKL